MEIIMVNTGHFQDYIIHNIENLLLFGNKRITVITEQKFFSFFSGYKDYIKLVDSEELDDFGYKEKCQLDVNFREGFWLNSSLRLFYVYSYMKLNDCKNCIHIENDVLVYTNVDTLLPKIKHLHPESKIYATYDCHYSVIPGIMFISNAHALKRVIENYRFDKSDMQNLANHDESVIIPFPIFPLTLHNKMHNITLDKINKNYPEFDCIFDAAAMGQYLGGVDKRNIPIGYDSRGFVNETCVVKYNNYTFYWLKNDNNLYVPYVIVDNKLIKIVNLHIHSKDLHKFMANDPLENKYIHFLEN